MNIKKQYEILKAIDTLYEALEIIYQHDYYGFPSHLPAEDQKPTDGEGGCMYKVDPYYDELYDNIFALTYALEKQISPEAATSKADKEETIK